MERSGSSGNAENGSHLVEVDAADGHAGQVERSGMSENAGTGSHLEVAPVTDAAGVHIGGSGSSGNAENGSHLAEVDAVEGHARAGCGCGGLTTATHDTVSGGR